MTIIYTGGNSDEGNSAAPSTGVHGVTINSGDKVYVSVWNNTNNDTITADAGGTTFTKVVSDFSPAAETGTMSCFEKDAGGSEPTSYTFSSGNSQWSVIIKVFSADDPMVVDSAANTDRETTSTVNLICNSANGAIISDNAVSIIVGAKDNRASGYNWTTWDNSYVSLIREVNQQASAMGHRIYTTGTTFSGDITSTSGGGNADETVNAHISFVESGAAALSIPIAMHHYKQLRGME